MNGMINWEAVWKVVFIVLMIAFAVMSVLVTVKGAADIKRLLTLLQNEAAAAEQHDNNVPDQT